MLKLTNKRENEILLPLPNGLDDKIFVFFSLRVECVAAAVTAAVVLFGTDKLLISTRTTTFKTDWKVFGRLNFVASINTF